MSDPLRISMEFSCGAYFESVGYPAYVQAEANGWRADHASHFVAQEPELMTDGDAAKMMANLLREDSSPGEVSLAHHYRTHHSAQGRTAMTPLLTFLAFAYLGAGVVLAIMWVTTEWWPEHGERMFNESDWNGGYTSHGPEVTPEDFRSLPDGPAPGGEYRSGGKGMTLLPTDTSVMLRVGGLPHTTQEIVIPMDSLKAGATIRVRASGTGVVLDDVQLIFEL